MMADEIQKTTPTLDRFSIAMLIEVLEGEDTLNQAEKCRSSFVRGRTQGYP